MLVLSPPRFLVVGAAVVARKVGITAKRQQPNQWKQPSKRLALRQRFSLRQLAGQRVKLSAQVRKRTSSHHTPLSPRPLRPKSQWPLFQPHTKRSGTFSIRWLMLSWILFSRFPLKFQQSTAHKSLLPLLLGPNQLAQPGRKPNPSSPILPREKKLRHVLSHSYWNLQ